MSNISCAHRWAERSWLTQVKGSIHRHNMRVDYARQEQERQAAIAKARARDEAQANAKTQEEARVCFIMDSQLIGKRQRPWNYSSEDICDRCDTFKRHIAETPYENVCYDCLWIRK